MLGTYLASDIRGLDMGPYEAVREVLERAVRDGIADDVVSDGFALDVDGDEATLTLLSQEDVTATFRTQDVLNALQEYVRLMERRTSR
jgi:hypothetical protein